ncbi:MAG: tetratricopeptide repeat protein [Anaerolineae bacterium]|nr:tetratricopeptide repeat protein [Anaerolineae bacterium]
MDNKKPFLLPFQLARVLTYLPYLSGLLIGGILIYSETLGLNFIRLLAIAALGMVLTLLLHPPLWYSVAGIRAAHRQNYPAALHYYNEILRMQPRNGRIYVSRGEVYRLAKAYRHAISDYDYAEAFKPSLTIIYNNRGACYIRLGDYEQAIMDFEEFIRRKPKHFMGYNNRGIVHARRGDYELALADYNRAIQLAPRIASIVDNKAELYFLMGDYDRALEFYQKTLQLDPQNQLKYAISGRACVYYAQGEQEKAQQEWQQLIEMNPRYRDVQWAATDLELHPREIELVQEMMGKTSSAEQEGKK